MYLEDVKNNKPHITKQHGVWWCVVGANISRCGNGLSPSKAYESWVSTAKFFYLMRIARE